VIEPGLLDLSPGKAHDEDAALKCDALGRATVGVATDGIVDDVGAVAFGHLVDDGDEVFRVPVDHDVRSQLLGVARREREVGFHLWQHRHRFPLFRLGPAARPSGTATNRAP